MQFNLDHLNDPLQWLLEQDDAPMIVPEYPQNPTRALVCVSQDKPGAPPQTAVILSESEMRRHFGAAHSREARTVWFTVPRFALLRVCREQGLEEEHFRK